MCPPSSITPTTSSKPIDITITCPETPICQSVYMRAFFHFALSRPILNHSLRVYFYATALAKHNNSVYFSDPAKHDLLFTACMLHDIGATDAYNGPARFEVEGADAAVEHLSKYGVTEQDKHEVWTAIALHTSPQIAERIGELSKLVRLAVITDFGRKSEAWDVLAPLKAKLEEDYGRAGIEKVLGDKVVEQAKRNPEKAPMASWPGVMYKSHLAEPEWEGVNRAF
jgi:HD superfamily phosphohydrolase YqeK